MYLMYVDESGDCGLPSANSPTTFFCLSGLVVHELRWREALGRLRSFRWWLKRRYGINVEDELHAGDMIGKSKNIAASLAKLPKYQRLAIIRNFADLIATLPDVNIVNVIVDKRDRRFHAPDDVFKLAWYCLIQRFENTIRNHNFPGPVNSDDCGIIFPDNTDGGKLKKFIDSMRVNNQLIITQASGAFYRKNDPIRMIIEYPVHRDSGESYFIQAADCAVFLLKQNHEPSGYMKQHGGKFYFNRMEKVLCKKATDKDPKGMGIVRP